MGAVGKETGKFNGALLRQYREAARLTQEQLSCKAGITQGYLSMIEAGKSVPTIGHAWTLAKILGVKMSALFGEAE